MSRPIQVYLDERDHKRLSAFAKTRGWTKSQAIRAAVRAMTRSERDDSILSLSGIIDGLPPDLSANFDRYLNETYVAERPRPYRPDRRKPRQAVRR
jgi:hypothetical protein